jgi:asparagine synthase (glutamine-hydrolysing)
VIDPIENRRKAFVKKAEALLPLVDGLSVHSCSVGDFAAVWAAGKWAPIDYLVDDEGAALVFGDAIERFHSRRLNAAQLRKLWGNSDIADPLEGFHAAFTYDQRWGLMVGADLMGMFPIYYYTSKKAILVGSSPELFGYHPCFKMKLDPEGLVGILLTKGPFNGKTLLSGVTKLAAGHLLRCDSEMEAREIGQFKLPMSTKYFGMSLSEQVEVLDKALEEAVARQVPKDERCCLMLSGGLDSTLLAGYLARADYDIVAITEGLETDNEMKSAKQIAGVLGFRHVQFQIGCNNCRQYSELTANWQHLSEGFTSVLMWGFNKQLRRGTSYVITGFAGDGILGTMVEWSMMNKRHVPSFSTLFEKISSFAFNPSTLRELLKKEYSDDLISRLLSEIKESHDSYPGLEFQKTWGFGLHHRIRVHDLSGIWPISFGAWPVLPFADSKVLETAGGFPVESLANRRVERELLRTKFPKLARIALAGYTMNTVPIARGFQHRVQQIVYGSGARSLRNQLLIRLMGERRYWPRRFDFDSPEWKIIRKEAEPYIQLTTQFFNKDSLNRLMPPADSKNPEVQRRMKRFGVTDESSLRIILGLALWSKDHLDAINNVQQVSNKEKRSIKTET